MPGSGAHHNVSQRRPFLSGYGTRHYRVVSCLGHDEDLVDCLRQAGSSSTPKHNSHSIRFGNLSCR